jgi:hypothetical protein
MRRKGHARGWKRTLITAKGAALLRLKLKRDFSIEQMRGVVFIYLRYGGISSVERDMWCTHCHG